MSIQRLELLEQDWEDKRALLFTSSEVNRLMAEPTKKAKESGQLLSDGAITYILEKVAARKGVKEPIYYTADMEWGNRVEPEAAIFLCQLMGYEPNEKRVQYGKDTIEGKILFYTFMDELGGSPDLILPDFGVEIKCPKATTHLYYKAYVNAENFQYELPKYYDQIQSNMFLTDKEYFAFFSYHPYFNSEFEKGHLIVIPRDQDRINKIIDKVHLAFDHMNQLIERL